MLKKKIKDEVYSVLKSYHCKDEYFYKKDIQVYQKVLGIIVEDNKLKATLPYPEFESLLSAFKKSPQKAIDDFFKHPEKSKPSKIKKFKKPKGIKKTRLPDIAVLKGIWEFLNFTKSPDWFKKRLIPLVRYKNYLIEEEKLREEYSHIFFPPLIKEQRDNPLLKYGYVCQILGIPYDKYFNDSDMKKVVTDIDSIVSTYIEYLKSVLSNITFIRGEKQENVSKWIVDIFSEATIKHYMPDLIKFKRKSYSRKPDFNLSFEKFKKFITGTPAKNLGYTRETYHIFRYRVVPQGAIILLHKVHELLYGEIDRERILLQDKFNLINNILKDVPPMTVIRDIFPKLLLDYSKKPLLLSEIFKKTLSPI